VILSARMFDPSLTHSLPLQQQLMDDAGD